MGSQSLANLSDWNMNEAVDGNKCRHSDVERDGIVQRNPPYIHAQHCLYMCVYTYHFSFIGKTETFFSSMFNVLFLIR